MKGTIWPPAGEERAAGQAAARVANPEYLLAMKCLSFRIGAEFHDEDDIRYLLRLLELRTYEQAVALITRYYPLERFPQKTLDALGELLPKS